MLEIRRENQRDISAISRLITLAFENLPMSDKREAEIVEFMRKDAALSISLVAIKDNEIAGHIAFSKIHINDQFSGWYGLAPVSVLPSLQNQGIGSKLIKEGLLQLKQKSANGWVLLGEPRFYQRFGFIAHPNLVLQGVPAKYFQVLSLATDIPKGSVKYHPAFG